MKFTASVLALLLLTAASAWAQDQAVINRSSELKDRGAADARTLATLPENTAVTVIARGGSGWTQVDANGQKGWVKAFHLRFAAVVEKGASSGGGAFSSLTSALSGRRSEKASVATTGVRGLSPEDLKNASPDGAALAKAQSYRADKPTAERFAREGKLSAVAVEEGGRR
ncbi:MAG TPA: SH3 domain-containing protein [Usitatibacter sp.]|nr:SH3 domain-containing protein [Usitatibacter sp.]